MYDLLFPLPVTATTITNQGWLTGTTTPDPDDGTETPLEASPDLSATKVDSLLVDADGNTSPSPGDTLRYTIVLENNGTTAATNVIFNDTPDSNTTLITGSVNTTQGSVTTGNGAGDSLVRVNVGEVQVGVAVTITFEVTIDNPLPPGVIGVANQGQVNSDNAPPTSTDDPDSPTPDDPTDTSVIAAPDMEAFKRAVLFDDVDGNSVPSPGDVLEYQISLVNAGNLDAAGVVFTDILADPNLSLVVGSVQVSTGTIVSGNTAGDSTVQVNVGPVRGNGGLVTITFRAAITNPLPAGVTEVSNQALVSSDNQPVEPSDDPTTPAEDDETTVPVTAAPKLSASKTDLLFTDADGDGVPSPGDTLLYSVVILNTGNAAATDIIFSDTPDPNTTLVVGSVQTNLSLGTVITGNTAGDSTVGVFVPALPGGDTAVNISFHVQVANPLVDGASQVINQGFVSSPSLPVDEPIEPTDDPDTPSEDDPTEIVMQTDPDLDAFKSSTLLVDADGNNRPSPGDTLGYRIDIANNGFGDALNVVLTDTPDINTVLVVGSVTTTWGSVITGNTAGDTTVGVDLGLIPGGATAVVSYQVLIRDPLLAYVISVTNQGLLTSDNNPPVPTDDPGTLFDPDDPTVTPIAPCVVLADDAEIDQFFTLAPEIQTDGTLYDRNFNVLGDKDWMRFFAVAGQVYTLTTHNLGGDVDTLLQLYDGDGITLLLENDDYQLGSEASQVVFTAAETDFYYLRVTHFDKAYDPGLSAICNNGYQVSVDTNACIIPSDAYEDDPFFSDAPFIGPNNSPLERTFHTIADKDWVRFTAVQDEVYTLTTRYLSLDVDTVLQLYDQDGETLLRQNDDYQPGSEASRIIWTAPQNGEYFARATHFDANYYPALSEICRSTYSVELDTNACSIPADDYEGDEFFTLASEILPNSEPVQRSFHTIADKDWSRFQAVAGQVYTLTTLHLSLDSDTVLQLYDQDGETLLAENDDYQPGSEASRIIWTAPESGPYYLRVTHFDNNFYPNTSDICAGIYSVQVETDACSTAPDQFEGDNFYTEATPLGLNGVIQQHSFHTIADKDWVSFTVMKGQVYTLTTFHLPLDVDTILQLYDQDGETLLLENDDYQPGSEASRIVWTAPESGVYYARVTHFDASYFPGSSQVCGNTYTIGLNVTNPALAVSRSMQDLNQGPLSVGDALAYEVSLTNQLNQPQYNLQLTVPEPQFSRYQPGTATVNRGHLLAESPLTVHLDYLAPGQTATLNFRTTVQAEALGQRLDGVVAVSGGEDVLVHAPLTSEVVQASEVLDRVQEIYLPLVLR